SFYCSGARRVLHSFPTRRSSDLGSCPGGPSDGVNQRPFKAGTPQWLGALGETYDACTSSGRSPSVVVRFHPSSPTTLSSVLAWRDRKSTRLNSSHQIISYAVFCL